MSKIEFTGNVQAVHMFVKDKLNDNKEPWGIWFPQVEVKTEAEPLGEMVQIKDESTFTGLKEAETKEEAIEKAKKWLTDNQGFFL